MPQRDANTLDLNMLRLFVVLYQEKNMRKAASRLHVTQPAISHSLKKLREHFSDQLFVKVPQGLEPTPLAHQIATVATAYIEGLSRELNSLTEFNPAEIEQTLRIAIASPILPCIAGNLYNRIKQYAPMSSLEIITWTQQTFDDLSQNKVILGINYNTAEHGKHIISKLLTDITPTYIARKDHPLLHKADLCLADFGKYEIASLIIPNWNENSAIAVEILKKHNIDAKLGMRSHELLALVDAASKSDMYIPHNDLFPIQYFPQLGIQSVAPFLLAEDYHLSVNSFVHVKDRHSNIANWLAGIIKECLLEQVDCTHKYLHS